MWGLDDPIVQPPATAAPAIKWGMDDPVIATQEENRSSMANAVLDRPLIPEIIRGPLLSTVPGANLVDKFYRPDADIRATMYTAGAGVVGPVARALGRGQVSDDAYGLSGAVEAAAQKRDEQGIVPSIVKRGIRGAASTLPSSIIAARAGGPYAALGLAAVQEGDRAITEAKQAGLQGWDVAKYAATQAAIEGGIGAVFQRFGFGGLEDSLGKAGRDVVNQSIGQALKQAGAKTLQELPEELVTEIGHNVASKLSGVDRDALTPEALTRTIAETAVQTIITMGAAESPNIAFAVSNRFEQARSSKERQAAAVELKQAIDAEVLPESARAVAEEYIAQPSRTNHAKVLEALRDVPQQQGASPDGQDVAAPGPEAEVTPAGAAPEGPPVTDPAPAVAQDTPRQQEPVATEQPATPEALTYEQQLRSLDGFPEDTAPPMDSEVLPPEPENKLETVSGSSPLTGWDDQGDIWYGPGYYIADEVQDGAGYTLYRDGSSIPLDSFATPEEAATAARAMPVAQEKPVPVGQFELTPPVNATPPREATVPGPQAAPAAAPQQAIATDREEFLRDVIAVMRGQPSPEFTPDQSAVQAEAARRGNSRVAIMKAESDWRQAKADQASDVAQQPDPTPASAVASVQEPPVALDPSPRAVNTPTPQAVTPAVQETPPADQTQAGETLTVAKVTPERDRVMASIQRLGGRTGAAEAGVVLDSMVNSAVRIRRARGETVSPESYYKRMLITDETLAGVPSEIVPKIENVDAIRAAARERDKKTGNVNGRFYLITDGRVLVRLFKTSKASTLPHEFAHVFRRWLGEIDPEMLAAAESSYGVKDGNWGEDQEEDFADDFTVFLATEEAPTPELKTIFARFREWLTQLWTDVKRSPLSRTVTPEMKGVFTRLLGGGDVKMSPKQFRESLVDSMGLIESILRRRGTKETKLKSAAQKVYVALLERESRYDPAKSSFTTWVGQQTTGIKLTGDRYDNAKTRRPEEGVGSLDVESDVGGGSMAGSVADDRAVDPAEAAMKEEQAAQVRKLVKESGLGPQEAQVIVRSVMGNDTLQEIADEWGVTHQRVSTVKKNAMKKLRKQQGQMPALAFRTAVQQTIVSTADQDGIAAADIARTWERIFDVPLRVGGFSERAAGVYKVLPEVVRTKQAHVANLAVLSHEIAHHIDKQTDFVANLPNSNALHAVIRSELAGLDYEPKGRLFEGFAEFFRHYVTEADAATVAPLTTRWFETVWLPQHPELAKKIAEARTQARKYATQSVNQRVDSAMDRTPQDLSWWERTKQSMRDRLFGFKAGWINRFEAVKEATEEAKKRGRGFSSQLSAYEAIAGYDRTADDMSWDAVDSGVFTLVGDKRISEGLWDLPSKVLNGPTEVQEAIRYAWAKHHEFIRTQLDNASYNTGLIDEDAAWILNYVRGDADKQARYDQVAKHISDFNTALLEMQVESGAMSRKYVDGLKQKYGDNYFPLLRIPPAEQKRYEGMSPKFVNLLRGLKGRTEGGSGLPVMNPFDATMLKAQEAYSRATNYRKQVAMRATFDPAYGGAEGMGYVMDRVDPKKYLQKGFISDVLNDLVKEKILSADDAKAMRIAHRIQAGLGINKDSAAFFQKRHGLSSSPTVADLKNAAASEPNILSEIGFWRKDFTPSASKATVLMHDADDTPYLYEMDRPIYEMAAGTPAPQLNAGLKVWKSAVSWFNAGAIGFNAAFGAQNLPIDMLESAGRAREMGVIEGFLSPMKWVGYYLANKTAKLAGRDHDNALITAVERLGGKMSAVVGTGHEARARYRKRQLGQEGWMSPAQAKDRVVAALESAKELITWSDLPPRLAEAEAAARRMGYEYRGKDWFEIGSTTPTTLPEHVRVRIGLAAANATTNFRQAGSIGMTLNQYMPLFNPAVQSLASEWEHGKRALSVFRNPTPEAKRALARTLFRSSLIAGMTAFYWAMRADDDDYQEDDYYRYKGWTIGWGGTTYFRIPKPRDVLGGAFSNAVEWMLDAWSGKGRMSATDLATREFLERVPMGGGPARTALELVADKDFYRNRSLTPAHLDDAPRTKQFTPYTLETSKALAKIIPLGSPIQVEHLLSGLTGGMYRRFADTAESLYQGRADYKHIPGLRAFYINRHQAASQADFYTAWEQSREAVQEDNAKPEAFKQKAKLDEYAAIIAAVRKDEPLLDEAGRKSGKYTPYIVGLSRQALGREAMDANPNPFFATDIPDGLKKILTEETEQMAKSVLLSHNFPQKPQGKDKTVDESLEKWRIDRDAKAEFLKEHAQSPIVQQAMAKVRASDSFKSLSRPIGDNEKPENYRLRVQKRNEAQAALRK